MEATEARNHSSTESLVFTPNMVHLTTALAQHNESNQAIKRQSCGSLFSRLPLNMTRFLVVPPIFRQKGHLSWGLADLGGVLKGLGTSRQSQTPTDRVVYSMGSTHALVCFSVSSGHPIDTRDTPKWKALRTQANPRAKKYAAILNNRRFLCSLDPFSFRAIWACPCFLFPICTIVV